MKKKHPVFTDDDDDNAQKGVMVRRKVCIIKRWVVGPLVGGPDCSGHRMLHVICYTIAIDPYIADDPQIAHVTHLLQKI